MDATNIKYVSLNALDGGEGQARHQQAGKPIIPSVLVDGAAYPIQHPTQVASILGLELEGIAATGAMAWDINEILSRWIEVTRGVPFDALLEPTRSRERSIRNLTVNTFRPIAYLPEAWNDHRFFWYTGEADLQQEAFLRTTDALVDFAQEIQLDYQGFLMEVGDELDHQDPSLESNRGEMTFSMLITSQRFHAAFHYRQILDHLGRAGLARGTPIPPGLAADIGLPEHLY